MFYIVGFGRQFQQIHFLSVELVFAGQFHIVGLLQRFAARAESQQNILIDHRAMLGEVVFLDALDFRRVNRKGIPDAENRAGIGLGDVDAHLRIFSTEVSFTTSVYFVFSMSAVRLRKSAAALSMVARTASMVA